MNLNERLEVLDESLALIKKRIVQTVTKKNTSFNSLQISPEQILKNVQFEYFKGEVVHMEEVMLLVSDSEDALEECKSLIILKDEQLKITKETNEILVNSLNALKPESEAVPA